MLVPNLLDTSSLSDMQQQESSDHHSKYDSKSIPLLQTMSAQFRELELPLSLDKRYILKQAPVFVPPHEYVVFPVRLAQYDNPHTIFQQAPTSVNQNSIGSYVHSSGTQQPPDVVTLEHYQQRPQHLTRTSPTRTTPPAPESEWDGRSDDPSRMHIRQFDHPYDNTARQALWMNKWAHQDYNATSNDRTQNNVMRIPVSAQHLAAASLVSDPQQYQTMMKQNSQRHQDQGENDTDLTSITKDSEDEYGNATQSDFRSSPRRHEVSFRKNSLDESVSLPIMSTDGGGDFGRGYDFRAPSRETVRDETPTYDTRDFPKEYYRGSPVHDSSIHPGGTPPTQMSPPTSNGFQQQQQPPPLQTSTLRSSVSMRRYLDDSNPNNAQEIEDEDRERYATSGKKRETRLRVK